ncbi:MULTISPECIES: tyrosine-type DNA invertase [Citrobacter]|uniref:tyrosine-type DNA invertase n=1 Tax=Citrobacter TaxID=544 RepID=UPI0002DB08AC|nr:MULTISPECIES: tyrosine-type DNA invertase [Citrobacter]MBA7794118.1 tyrosine-type recombinase/integrase [Citrobacter sp. RHBSTW-01065]ELK7434909.1 tyrosine-type recombinase/integrase [Citrobacter braakii]KAA0547695.1 tyrosine-type recombinase/integrase [Citrobacter braakii]MBJ9029570.1 tyrosine-type recombinase/integrase [Citrobacter braakii]MBJ9049158.1 tyrosine-type recombinase/integrase [Citrobacter braakii]
MSSRKFLTHHEVSLLLQVTHTSRHPERDACMILLAFLHGLRVSELLSLRLTDLELVSRKLCVRRLKNGFSTIHPLLDEEVKCLRSWLTARATIKSPTAEEEGDWLFISRSGRPLTRQRFYDLLAEAGKKAGLAVSVHPHMLRHGCGYALADNGIDTRLIQDYLGHRNIRHTVIYTASNSARFERVWNRSKRGKKQLFDPNCKLPALQDAILKKHVLCSQQLINK